MMETNPNGAAAWSAGLRLGRDDFRAESNPAAFEDSHSTIRYRCTWTVDSERDGDDGRIVFSVGDVRVHAEFYPGLSWVRETQAGDALLRHEQGHFDLAELVGREGLQGLQDRFRGRRFPIRGRNEEQARQHAREDSGAMISEEVRKLERELERRRREYDAETDFGRNAQRQSEYELDLDRRLRG